MAKKILDELKWHPEKSLERVEIIYIHRGAPGDILITSADTILRFEKSFFIIDRGGIETSIPYHRIKEIRKDEKILWKKKNS
jgi:uncharacterized protein (UPF0248 family)